MDSRTDKRPKGSNDIFSEENLTDNVEVLDAPPKSEQKKNNNDIFTEDNLKKKDGGSEPTRISNQPELNSGVQLSSQESNQQVFPTKENPTPFISKEPYKGFFGSDVSAAPKEFNQQFENITGYKGFDLTEPAAPQQGSLRELLGSDLQKKREETFEDKKFNTYIKEAEKIDELANKVHGGVLSLDGSDIIKAAENPFSQNIVKSIVAEYKPEAATDLTNPQNAAEASFAINAKNRINSVNARAAQLMQYDAELKNDWGVLQNDNPPVGVDDFTKETVELKKNIPVPNLNDNNSISSTISKLQELQNREKIRYMGLPLAAAKSQKEIENLIGKLKSRIGINTKDVSENITWLNDKIEHAVVSHAITDNQSEPESDDVRVNQFKLGLSAIEYSDPVLFKNVTEAIAKKSTVAPTDYSYISNVGQDIYNRNIFKSASISPDFLGKETNFDYTTFEEKKAKAAGDIGEWLKAKGIKNTFQFSDKSIMQAANELGIDKNVAKKLALEEALPAYDAIPKSGALDALVQGMEQPIEGILSTVEGLSETPAETYLRSKQLSGTGMSQKVPTDTGYDATLQSEKGKFWTGALQGMGQFLTQVALAKGAGVFGSGAAKALNLGVKGTEIATIYGGTALPIYLQTYGQSYEQFLNQNGDPAKSSLMAHIASVLETSSELWLPDVKIANMAAKGLRDEAVDGIFSLIKKGGDPADIALKTQSITDKFLKALGKTANIGAQEIGEEVYSQIGGYVAQSILDPNSALKRDLNDEVWQTIKQTALSMALPSILGGAGNVMQKDFTVQTLHNSAINFDEAKEGLEKQLDKGLVTQDELNSSIKLLATHKQSIEAAPDFNANGDVLNSAQKLNYALEDTKIKVYDDKIKNTTGVQKEMWEQKKKASEDVQREILIPETKTGTPEEITQPIELSTTVPSEESQTENKVSKPTEEASTTNEAVDNVSQKAEAGTNEADIILHTKDDGQEITVADVNKLGDLVSPDDVSKKFDVSPGTALDIFNKWVDNNGKPLAKEPISRNIVEPAKPISEMNSEEIGNYATEVRQALRQHEKEFEGKTEAEKEAGGYYDYIDNVAELRDTEQRVNFVENSENLDDLANSTKSALRDFNKDNPSQESLAILNAAKKRADELNIEPETLIKEVIKKVGNDYKDKDDAEFMMRNYLEKIVPDENKPTISKEQDKGGSESEELGVGTKWDSPSGKKEITGSVMVGKEKQFTLSIDGKHSNELIKVADLQKDIARDKSDLIHREEARKEGDITRDKEAKKQEFYNNTNGFADGKSPMEKAKILKVLNTEQLYNGKLKVRKTFIEDAVANGATVKEVNGKKRLYYNDNRFIDNLTKTEYDYADYLNQIKNKPKEQTEPTGFTSKEVIDEGYRKIKSEIGEKKAKKYFEQVNRLLSPNENTIVEYRKNGVITKEGDKYIFHPLADMDLKNWRVAEINDKAADVTSQFESKNTEPANERTTTEVSPKVGVSSNSNEDKPKKIQSELEIFPKELSSSPTVIHKSKNNFKILTPDGIKNVSGQKVDLEGYNNLDLFIHRESTKTGKGGDYVLTEERTGLEMGRGDTAKAAAERGVAVLKWQQSYNKDFAPIYEQVNRHIDKSGTVNGKGRYEDTPIPKISSTEKVKILESKLDELNKEIVAKKKEASRYLSSANTEFEQNFIDRINKRIKEINNEGTTTEVSPTIPTKESEPKGQGNKESLQPSTESTGRPNAEAETTVLKPKKDLGQRAREEAAKYRAGEKSVLPDFLKAKLPEGTKLSGIDINEAWAKALETFADVHDATKDFAKAIDEGFKHIKEWFDENKVPYNEKELKDGFKGEMGEPENISGKGNKPPIEGNEVAEGEEGGKIGQRRFTKQVLADEAILPKDQIAKRLDYVVRTNEMTINEATKIINDIGVDEAYDVVVGNRDVHPAVRTTMGQMLIKKFNNLASQAKDEGTKNYYWDKTIDIANFVSEKLGTEAGQSIQAFSLYSRLSPEAQLRGAIKQVKEQSASNKKKAERDVNSIGDKFKKVNEETAEAITKSKKVKDGIDNAESKRVVSAKNKIQKARERRDKIIKKYKSEKGKNLYSGVGLTKEGIEFVGDLAKTYIDEGIANLQILAEKIKENLKSVSGKDIPDDVNNHITSILKPLVEVAENTKIAKSFKELEKDIHTVIKEHYTVPEETKTTLINKFMNKVGLEESDAKELAKVVEEEFDKTATRRKEDILEKEKARFERIQNKLGGAKKVEKKTLQAEAIRFSNLGAFDNNQLLDMLSEKLGTGQLTAEQGKEIQRLAERIEKAPEGRPKNEATEDLLTYRASIKGTNWAEVAQGVWYANVLSGMGTHIKNIVSTGMNGFAFFSVEAARDPKSIPFLLYGGAKGFKRGAIEAGHTLKTGRSPIHVSKIELPNILERVKFKGGYLNPANYLKFVGRLMVGEDVLQFQGLKEMRATQLAYREAKKMGYKNPFNKKVWDVVNDRLLDTPERYKEASEQAKLEGVSGREAKRRIYELMEQSRPIKMTEDAYGFAAKGTFNHATEGTLGALTNWISKGLDMDVGGARPLRFLVPFTRIITNVANNTLDFSPIGLVRAARGTRGFEGFKKSQLFKDQYHVMTKEERQQTLAKASLGILSMAGLYALAALGKVEVTGSGPDDIKKKLQLMQGGWQDYSIKIGDKYYSYKLTPMVFAWGIIGSIRDHQNYDKGADEETILQRTTLATWDGIKNIGDMTWVNSAAPIMSALSSNNPGEAGALLGNVGRNVSKSFLIPNAYTQSAQRVQNIFNMPQKQVNNAFESLIMDVPIARNTLNDKINALGDPIVRDVDILVSQEKKDPVFKYLLDKKGWVAPVNKRTLIVFDFKTQQDRPVTDDEYYEFSKLRGSKIKEGIADIMKNGAMVKTGDTYIVKSAQELTSSELNKLLTPIKTKATKETKQELFSGAEGNF